LFVFRLPADQAESGIPTPACPPDPPPMSVSTPTESSEAPSTASFPEASTVAGSGPAPSASGSASPATASAAQPAATPSPEGSVYAIVEAGGQQVWLQPNRYLDLNRIDAAVDSTVTLDTVLLVKGSGGTTLGQPYVKGATVELAVMAHRRGPKILVYKMRRKKKTRRKTGHRQELTRVMVRSISVGGQPVA
jgi:large subunit ribosomal protein L21